MRKGRGYWLGTASSGAKFEKLSKYDEIQSYNLCAYHSFGNSCSCITAVKWGAYDVENAAARGKARRYRINSRNSSRFHPGNNTTTMLGGPCHIPCYAGYFFFSQAARGQFAYVIEISPFALRKKKTGRKKEQTKIRASSGNSLIWLTLVEQEPLDPGISDLFGSDHP